MDHQPYHATIGEQIDKAAAELPDAWRVRIDVEGGWAGVKLIDPDGGETDMYAEGAGIAGQIGDAIAKAKRLQQEVDAEEGETPAEVL